MKPILVSFLALLLFFSCKKHSEIATNFKCKSAILHTLEEVKDVKNLFTIQLPKNWKTNLYYDAAQTSIYTADTTKQLTETLLLDVTLIENNINFNENFKLQQEQESLAKKLIQTESKELKLLSKPSFYTLSKGKKRTFNYQILKTFIKINEQNFMLVKAEIYGDSLSGKRLCKAISLIEKIKILQ